MRRWKRNCDVEETKQLTSLLGQDFDVCESMFTRVSKWASKKTKGAVQYIKGADNSADEKSVAFIEVFERAAGKSNSGINALRGGVYQQTGSSAENSPSPADKESGPGEGVVGSQCGGRCYEPWSPPTCEDVCEKVSEGSDDYFQYSVLGECATPSK
jgi:hypothetical protein